MQPASRLLRGWLIMGAYALLVLGPTLVLGVQTSRELTTTHPEWLILALPVGRRLGLLANSIGLALAVGVVCSLLGWLAAVWLWSRRSRYAWPIVLAALPLSAVPVYIYALAWFTGAEQLAEILGQLGLAQVFRSGVFGVLTVEACAYTPLAAAFVWLGLRSIHPELVEAARLRRPDLECLARVVFPLSAPTLSCAAAIIFLMCVLDYSVPSLMQVPVYSMEVFAEYSASHSPERAFLLSIPLIVVATLGLLVLSKPLQTLVARATFRNQAWGTPAEWPAWFEKLLNVSLAILILTIFLPLIIIATRMGSPSQAIDVWVQAGAEVGVSVRTAWLAMAVSLPLAILVGAELLSGGRLSWIKWVLVLAPLSIPASLTGIGLIPINQTISRGFSPLQWLLPALACLARFAPFAVLIFAAQQRRQDTLLLEAASVLQKSGWRRLIWVQLPLVSGGGLVAAGLVFALSMGELGAILMVISPGQATVSIRLFNYLHYGASEVVAGLSLMMAGVVLGVYTLVLLAAWASWRQFATQGAEK